MMFKQKQNLVDKHEWRLEKTLANGLKVDRPNICNIQLLQTNISNDVMQHQDEYRTNPSLASPFVRITAAASVCRTQKT
jgi:hypothetical protein